MAQDSFSLIFLTCDIGEALQRHGTSGRHHHDTGLHGMVAVMVDALQTVTVVTKTKHQQYIITLSSKTIHADTKILYKPVLCEQLLEKHR